MRSLFRALCTLCIAVGAPLCDASNEANAQPATTAPTYRTAADIPADVFFRLPQFAQMTLSPNGRKLALLAPSNGRNNLSVIDLASKKATLLTSYDLWGVFGVSWIDDERLYFQTANMAEASGELFLRGRYAVDVDGKNLRDLTRPTTRTQYQRGTATTFRILNRTWDGTGEVIAEINERSSTYPDVYRYNTRTGVFRLLTQDSPGNVIRWVTDWDHVARVAVKLEDRVDPTKPRAQSIWYRTGEGKPWEKIFSSASEDGSGVWPLTFDFDNTTLYVSSNVDQDKRAIYTFDIVGKKLGERLLAHPMVDVSGGLMFSRTKKKLVGITYTAEETETAWFDEELAKLKASINKTFPTTRNNLTSSFDSDAYILINAVSDRDPGAYYLYDVAKKAIERIGKARPWLPPELMSERKFIRYKARDGREIPAWVTIPRNSDGKNLPLIVNIHGGPWVRSYGYNDWGRPEAQFFASRGYAVLEPEPRGSTGFGRDHYTSSFGQFGLTMQDDITDGALHLAQEGIVDKSRMCLFGGSYGGYAALQGLVRDPDLWKCANAFVAVTDLELWQSVRWSDTARLTDFFETDFKRRVGDKERDRERFQKTSPAKNADKIKAPVMLTMGSFDERVPLVHGESMSKALRAAGRDVEYVVYQGEGHGFNKMENVVDFYQRSERFFAKHLKSERAASGATPIPTEGPLAK